MSRCKLGQDDQRLHLRTYATGRRFQQSDLDATTRDALDRESEDEGAEVAYRYRCKGIVSCSKLRTPPFDNACRFADLAVLAFACITISRSCKSREST